jgi:eukaryotic-like serine/threonine-protein kinase
VESHVKDIGDFVTGGALRWFGSASADTPAAPDDDRAALLPGSRLGPYRIESLIGRGGSSLVYRARRCDDAFSQTVAIKIVRGDIAADAARLERDYLARLSHPFIARIFDAGMSNGAHWFAMEFVDGAPIDRHAIDRDLDWRARLSLLERVCEAIGQAHELGLVHRDIKPSNILVDRDGNPRIIDFGIALDLRGKSDDSRLAWTAAYASPEQVAGDDVTVPSDIYQLGLLIRELLLEPGRTRSPTVDAKPPSLPAIARRSLAAVIAKACADDPRRRQGSARQLADDLSRIARHRPPLSGGLSAWAHVRLLLQRRAFSVAAIAVTLALVAAGLSADRIADQASAARRADEIQLAQSGRAFLSRALMTANANATGNSPLDRLDAAAERTRHMSQTPAVRVAALEALTDAYFDAGMGGATRAKTLVAATVDEFERDHPMLLESRARLATLLARCEGATASVDAFRKSLGRAERLHRDAGIDPHSLPALSLGRYTMVALEREDRLDESIALGTRLIETADPALHASSELARVLHRRGHLRWEHQEDPGALADLRRAKTIFDMIYGPAYPLTTYLSGVIAEIEAVRGNAEGARRELEAAFATAKVLFPPDAIEIAHAQSVLGTFLVNWGAKEEDAQIALQHLAPAYRTLSHLDRRRLQLGIGQDYATALIETGSSSEAKAVLQTVLEQRCATHPEDNPYVVWTRMQIIQAECLAGEAAQAMSKLDDIYTDINDYASSRWTIYYWTIRSRCLLHQQRTDEARLAFQEIGRIEPDSNSLVRRLFRRSEAQLQAELADRSPLSIALTPTAPPVAVHPEP